MLFLDPSHYKLFLGAPRNTWLGEGILEKEKIGLKGGGTKYKSRNVVRVHRRLMK